MPIFSRHKLSYFIYLVLNKWLPFLFQSSDPVPDSSSNLGIVCPPAGETLVLAATNSTELPTVVTTLTYITAAYAREDASQNPNILYLPEALTELQL